MTKNREPITKEIILLRIQYWITRYRWKLKTIFIPKFKKTIPLFSELEIELQSDCNRDCFFCPRYEDRSGIRKDSTGKHIKKSMPTNKIYDIIDQVTELGYRGFLSLHRLSEPFMDKRYIEIATYARKKGLKIWEYTNGDFLKNNPEFCKKLDGLIYKISIGLYDYKNEQEKKEQMKFWRNRFKKTKVTFSLAAEFPVIRQNSKLYDKKLINEKIRNLSCFRTTGLRIRYDGEVSLCCEDDPCVFNLGNVFNSSIKDIWWSENHIKIVNSLKVPGGRNAYSKCRDCLSDVLL